MATWAIRLGIHQHAHGAAADQELYNRTAEILDVFGLSFVPASSIGGVEKMRSWIGQPVFMADDD